MPTPASVSKDFNHLGMELEVAVGVAVALLL